MVASLQDIHYRFPEMMALVGRILTDYGELEITLMNCVQVARKDLDGTLKAMFRVRSERQRIEIADGLGRAIFQKWELETHFCMALGDLRHALDIRNQYAHCIWRAPRGVLQFADIEPLAKQNQPVRNLDKIEFVALDSNLLRRQQQFLTYVDASLAWVNYELRALRRQLPRNPLERPRRLERPPLDNRPKKAAIPPDSAKGQQSPQPNRPESSKRRERDRKTKSARK